MTDFLSYGASKDLPKLEDELTEDNFRFWLKMPLDKYGDYRVVDRLLEVYRMMEYDLKTQGIYLRDNFDINFMRFSYMVAKHSTI